MLTKIEVLGISGTTLTLPLNSDILGAPIQIRGVDGLGPVKATIATSSYATIPGAKFAGSRTDIRNIVLKLGLSPDWAEQTMESLRGLLYQYFMPEFEVRLRFFSTHLPTCEIWGHVEDFIDNMFSRDPEISVSIICPQPHFVDIDETVVEDITRETSDLDFDQGLFEYLGNAPTGFILEIAQPDGGSSGTVDYSLLIEPAVDQGVIEIVASDLVVNSVHFFRFSSEDQKKFARSILEANEFSWTSVLSQLSTPHKWPKLLPGQNRIRVAYPDGVSGLRGTRVRFRNRFGGL